MKRLAICGAVALFSIMGMPIAGASEVAPHGLAERVASNGPTAQDKKWIAENSWWIQPGRSVTLPATRTAVKAEPNSLVLTSATSLKSYSVERCRQYYNRTNQVKIFRYCTFARYRINDRSGSLRDTFNSTVSYGADFKSVNWFWQGGSDPELSKSAGYGCGIRTYRTRGTIKQRSSSILGQTMSIRNTLCVSTQGGSTFASTGGVV